MNAKPPTADTTRFHKGRERLRMRRTKEFILVRRYSSQSGMDVHSCTLRASMDGTGRVMKPVRGAAAVWKGCCLRGK